MLTGQLRGVSSCLAITEKEPRKVCPLAAYLPECSRLSECLSHLALAETRIKEAAGCYKESIRLGGIEEFDKAMKEDIKVLVQHGVDSGFLDLLRDKLLYDLD